MKFQGKTAIVTGAGRGIGYAIADAFVCEGASVVIAEIDEKTGKDAARKLSDKGKVIFVKTDISMEDSVREMVKIAVSEFGTVCILVNNAAIAIPSDGPVAELDYDHWKRVLNVNLSGAMLCAKHSVVHLRQSLGCIVNIASTRALMSEPDSEAYGASKGGLVALTHALAMSLGPQVRVNCISPGWIVTDDNELSRADLEQHPVGRVGRPEDIAQMVLYLCSDAAGFITGQNFVVDGGMTKKMIYV